MLRKGIIAMSLLVLSGAVSADIYRWVDQQGRSHFSDRPPNTVQSEPVTVKINTYSSPSYSPDILSFDDEQKPFPQSSHKVTIYSTSWCGVCQKAKAYFKSHYISYTEYDVETTARGKADFQQMQGKGVPIILVGNRRLNGFTPQLFENLYKQ